MTLRAQNHRIHLKKDFELFFKCAQVFHLSVCVVFRVRQKKKHYRLAFAFKKHIPAVWRNKMKRQIRAWFQKKESFLGSYDYLIVLRKNFVPQAYALSQVRDCLDQELLKALKARKKTKA